MRHLLNTLKYPLNLCYTITCSNTSFRRLENLYKFINFRLIITSNISKKINCIHNEIKIAKLSSENPGKNRSNLITIMCLGRYSWCKAAEDQNRKNWVPLLLNVAPSIFTFCKFCIFSRKLHDIFCIVYTFMLHNLHCTYIPH